MIHSIFRTAFDACIGILGIAFLVRFWVQAVKTVPPLKVTGILIRLTDWLLSPARKVLPVKSNHDWAALICAVVMAFVSAAGGAFFLELFAERAILFLAGVTFIHWIIYGFMGMMVMETIFSWINPFHPAAFFVADMTKPVLKPIRRLVPALGGIDFSAVIAFFLLQIVSGFLTNYVLSQIL